MKRFCFALCCLALLSCLGGIVLLGIGDEYVPMGMRALNSATTLLIVAGLLWLPVAFHAWKMHWWWSNPTDQRPTSAG